MKSGALLLIAVTLCAQSTNPSGGFGKDSSAKDSFGKDFGRPIEISAVDYQGRGEGYIRRPGNPDHPIADIRVSISREGRVQVELGNGTQAELTLTGRIVHVDTSRKIASVSSASARDVNVRGTMELLVDSRGFVAELAMTGVGRNRAEIYWKGQ